jgi:exo-beta-1,3-glucanase (GH17 family)/cellulose synthase/poly-beta-1,6-N-acetylglucosamine synthase-like glycosyltransferase
VPSPEAIQSDLEILARKSKSIRLYNAKGLEEVPGWANAKGLTLIASAWLGGDPELNAAEVEAAIQMAGRNRSVKRLIIGNETQLKNTVPFEELKGYLDKARKRLRTPVSTAEPWDFWLQHPDLADHVDFIAIHILPYWMEVPIESAVDYVFEKYRAVQERFPGRVIVIAEAGWPSEGPQRGAAQASLENQATFVREFVQRANKEKVLYNVIEAFDQPWKSALEGKAGEHFGIMNANREDKFPFTGTVLGDPNWELWMISSMLIGLVGMIVFFTRRPDLGKRAQLFSALVLQGVASSVTQLAREASGEYLSPGDIVFWTITVAAHALLAIIFLTDTAEIADVVGRRPLRRKFGPAAPTFPEDKLPMVSLHVACCREPPELVIQTIESLAKLDYPRLEVLVIDNNTPDEALWRPVEKRCAELGSRFRFFSLGKWPGFKAGALNFGLSKTAPEAEVIGVVDADYVVDPSWLRSTTPYFSDAEVAVVQCPQEHRDVEDSLFEQMANDEYAGFFRIGMVQRNEDNAIIQHGTMTLVRRPLLDALGGWAEWCITEDTELGLRLLNLGKSTVYIDHPFGRGLVPDSYEAYKKQRFRWAYGGMRILRRYLPELLGFRGRLRREQRYQFLKGWLPWIGDALHMFFTAAAIVWSVLLVWKPLETDFPEAIFIVPALGLVVLRLLGTAWTYAHRVRIGSERTLLAMVAGGSLTHAIAKAVFQGLFTSGLPFYRTPKMASAPRLVQSLVSVWEEGLLLTLLIGLASGILVVFGLENDAAILWSAALCIQGIPYAASVVASVLSTRGPRSL